MSNYVAMSLTWAQTTSLHHVYTQRTPCRRSAELMNMFDVFKESENWKHLDQRRKSNQRLFTVVQFRVEYSSPTKIGQLRPCLSTSTLPNPLTDRNQNMHNYFIIL